MSLIKDQYANRDSYKDIAKDILSNLNAINYCPIHDWYSSIDEADDLLYAKATNMLKAKYPEYDDFSTFHAMIKEVIAEGSSDDACPDCLGTFSD